MIFEKISSAYGGMSDEDPFLDNGGISSDELWDNDDDQIDKALAAKFIAYVSSN